MNQINLIRSMQFYCLIKEAYTYTNKVQFNLINYYVIMKLKVLYNLKYNMCFFPKFTL